MTQPSASTTAEHAAASSRSLEFTGKLRYFFIAAVCVVLDLISKWWAFDVVTMTEVLDRRIPHHPVIPGFFSLVQMKNPGAVGGLGGDYPWALVALRIGAVFVLSYVILRVSRVRWFLLSALVLVLGGAIGNLYDNLRFAADGRPGEVRDFLFFDLKGIGISKIPGLVTNGYFNAFNIADSCIVCGAISLVILSFVAPKRS